MSVPELTGCDWMMRLTVVRMAVVRPALSVSSGWFALKAWISWVSSTATGKLRTSDTCLWTQHTHIFKNNTLHAYSAHNGRCQLRSTVGENWIQVCAPKSSIVLNVQIYACGGMYIKFEYSPKFKNIYIFYYTKLSRAVLAWFDFHHSCRNCRRKAHVERFSQQA